MEHGHQLGLATGETADLDKLVHVGTAARHADGLLVGLVGRIVEVQLILPLGELGKLALQAHDPFADSHGSGNQSAHIAPDHLGLPRQAGPLTACGNQRHHCHQQRKEGDGEGADQYQATGDDKRQA